MTGVLLPSLRSAFVTSIPLSLGKSYASKITSGSKAVICANAVCPSLTNQYLNTVLVNISLMIFANKFDGSAINIL
jgi:hypothetical protein